MFSEETLYAIALRHCPSIGDFYFKKLVTLVGSAKNVWGMSPHELNKRYGISSKVSSHIGKDEHLFFAEKELEFCYHSHIKILLSHRGELPGLLQQCEDAPSILYQKGKFHFKNKNISIVGTRSCTSYGKNFITGFLEAIKASKIQTISGLALGTDTTVHSESLKNRVPTVAILAHGFRSLYPSKNKILAERILEDGALLSEFTSHQPPLKENFIQRNRIIAGISPATIITETAYAGGAISTAHFANRYNRKVLALPGPIHQPIHQGCNLLIAQNKARILISIPDTLDYLHMNPTSQKSLELFPPQPLLSNAEQRILLSLIVERPNISLEEISEKVDWPSYRILPILLDLELLGCIKSTSGRLYAPI
ncbi:DNA-protecting protein DprA [Elizabethkingia argentiflava]|uniref:DNA-protecting protein DprA n=1 Tax=Elizabethkingia argenteiflava TaxID=2681556 RepID=A0A845PRQ9_9FLAO|nr:DNA-processing protein DprA [Elizabethkingia argenteiflava]NAW50355.1 DNA-protecting protein DprA [Elizabethkingia argenteiflava]